jgi:hypothetical protein
MVGYSAFATILAFTSVQVQTFAHAALIAALAASAALVGPRFLPNRAALRFAVAEALALADMALPYIASFQQYLVFFARLLQVPTFAMRLRPYTSALPSATALDFFFPLAIFLLSFSEPATGALAIVICSFTFVEVSVAFSARSVFVALMAATKAVSLFKAYSGIKGRSSFNLDVLLPSSSGVYIIAVLVNVLTMFLSMGTNWSSFVGDSLGGRGLLRLLPQGYCRHQ